MRRPDRSSGGGAMPGALIHQAQASSGHSARRVEEPAGSGIESSTREGLQLWKPPKPIMCSSLPPGAIRRDTRGFLDGPPGRDRGNKGHWPGFPLPRLMPVLGALFMKARKSLSEKPSKIPPHVHPLDATPREAADRARPVKHQIQQRPPARRGLGHDERQNPTSPSSRKEITSAASRQSTVSMKTTR